MNNDVRKKLQAISSTLEEQKGELEGILSDEEEKLDNMPDGLRNSDKGQAQEEVVDKMRSAMDNLDTAIGEIQEASGG